MRFCEAQVQLKVPSLRGLETLVEIRDRLRQPLAGWTTREQSKALTRTRLDERTGQ